MSRKDQKATRYRRNRRFGDIHGGRERLRRADNIFMRSHSLKPPGPHDLLPIYLNENPSRDFYFPITSHEVDRVLGKLPHDHVKEITHVWFRRAKRSDYESHQLPLALFTCGSGVRCITLYPWPVDNRMPFPSKPSSRIIRWYKRWGAELVAADGRWHFQWVEAQVKNFYLDHLLLHEIGHHVDWYYRRWTKANRRQLEDEANRYAYWWSAQRPKGDGTYDVSTSGEE